jgi:hypothetical protein
VTALTVVACILAATVGLQAWLAYRRAGEHASDLAALSKSFEGERHALITRILHPEMIPVRRSESRGEPREKPEPRPDASRVGTVVPMRPDADPEAPSMNGSEDDGDG